MENRIIYNAIKTPDGTILHSKHVHDFITYKDKNGKQYGVDGGNNYLRRIGDISDIEDISVYDDNKHETRRKYLCWGRNFDKDMNRLPRTEWIPIKEMSTEHIQAIIDGGFAESNVYFNDIFKDELKFRSDDNK